MTAVVEWTGDRQQDNTGETALFIMSLDSTEIDIEALRPVVLGYKRSNLCPVCLLMMEVDR